MKIRLALATTVFLGLGLTLPGCGEQATEPVKTTETPRVDPDKPKETETTKTGESSMPPGYKAPEGSTDPTGKSVEGTPAKAEEPKKDEPKVEEPKKDEPKATAVALSEKEIANIKKLPDAADQEAALAQKICPVGEDEDTKAPNHLGAMGKPIKEVVNGKTVFVCCAGCIDDLKKEPAKYLAKIGK